MEGRTVGNRTNPDPRSRSQPLPTPLTRFRPARCGRTCRETRLPSDQRTVARWFNTSLFSQPAALTFGNSPRSVLRGAPIVTTDATLEKSFTITERTKFDMRGEFYNLFNHAIFNVPGAMFGAADFGVVSSARPGRTVQLAARLSF